MRLLFAAHRFQFLRRLPLSLRADVCDLFQKDNGAQGPAAEGAAGAGGCDIPAQARRSASECVSQFDAIARSLVVSESLALVSSVQR